MGLILGMLAAFVVGLVVGALLVAGLAWAFGQ